ncbi:hypothetical protein VTN77DRAFT_1586 [Rasamsonia byssochlamydoides]|uniref:uncharacterized protein n=1 Tax=Rasamsonia byssochlamydoides TaxID=89139 RepID=UPI003742F1BE
MSVDRSTPPSHQNTQDSRSYAKKSIISELDSLNLRLGHLKDKILPASPYLLTVPTDVPFRLGNRFVNNWAVGKDGPFTPEEQQLQYMTFLMHHEADSLLVAVGDWSDKGGNIMAEDDSKPRSVESAANTSQNTSTKKKISLSDYKTKAKGGTSSSSIASQEGKNGTRSSEEAVNNRQDISKSQSTDRIVTERRHGYPLSEPEAINGTSGQPPRIESPDKAKKPQHAERSDFPSPKRPRFSPPKSTTKGHPRSDSANNGLPALLSPTLPPSSTSPRLPELLSPTLPPDIEEELARLREESPIKSSSYRRNFSTTSVTTKDETANIKFSQHKRPHSESVSSASTQSTNAKKGEQANKSLSHGSSKRSDSASRDHSKTDSTLRPAEKQSPLLSSGVPAKTNASFSNDNNSVENASSKPKLLVRLKYGRANRKRVEALLKFSGKRKILADSVPSKQPRDYRVMASHSEEGHLSSHETDSHHSASKNREKRPRVLENNDIHEPSSKRPKAVTKTTFSDKSHTPISATSKSPSTKEQPVMAKSLFSTPKKEAKGGSVRRPESGDSEVVKTPSGSTSKAITGSAEKPTKLSPPPSSDSQASRSRDSERRAWREEFQKYANLGRELKHQADRHTRSKAANENVTAADEKLAAATAVEAILCFILAFIADDRSKALARQVGDSSTWRSILAYWRVVKMTTASYPRLHGLCLLLGAISHDTIHALDLERLAVCSLPGEHSPVPTPGSDGNTVTSDESKKYRKEFLELKARLPEYYKEAHRLWLEGGRELSDDIIMQEFPATWSKRSRNFAERGRERLSVGNYSGGFFLPLGRTTTPLEAVRFGVSILGEWCKREGLEFEARLGL